MRPRVQVPHQIQRELNQEICERALERAVQNDKCMKVEDQNNSRRPPSVTRRISFPTAWPSSLPLRKIVATCRSRNRETLMQVGVHIEPPEHDRTCSRWQGRSIPHCREPRTADEYIVPQARGLSSWLGWLGMRRWENGQYTLKGTEKWSVFQRSHPGDKPRSVSIDRLPDGESA